MAAPWSPSSLNLTASGFIRCSASRTRTSSTPSQRHAHDHSPESVLTAFGAPHRADLQPVDGHEWRPRGEPACLFEHEHVVGLAELRDRAQDTEPAGQIDVFVADP